uniref:Uncharacterized protein n=1 Tax=Anguilla anguilla TaxID=7936 RepID=A0A0E9SBK7_ANGAN
MYACLFMHLFLHFAIPPLEDSKIPNAPGKTGRYKFLTVRLNGRAKRCFWLVISAYIIY